MKKLTMLLMLLALLAFSGFAYAESINLGGKTINYNIPDGYVKAQGPAYSMLLGVMQQAMPSGLRIQAMYVAQADDDAFRSSNGEEGLDNYLIITTMDQLANQSVSSKDFKDFKRELKENHGLLDDAQGIVKERLDDVFDGQIQIGGMQALGCFGETDTELSYVVIMDQQANIDGKMIYLKQALVFTGVLINEKLIFVNQYRTVESEAEVSAFQDYTLNVLKQMNFSSTASQPASGNDARATDARTSSPTTESGKKSGMGGIILIIIIVVIIVVIIGVVLSKKKANGGNPSGRNHIDNNRE